MIHCVELRVGVLDGWIDSMGVPVCFTASGRPSSTLTHLSTLLPTHTGSEIRDDTSNSSSNKEPPSLLEASRFASSFGDSDTAPRPAPPPPTDRDISSRRGDGWAALYRARGGAFLGSALLPTKKEERGSGGRWLLRWAAMLLPSLPWPGAAASPSPANAAAEGETEELVGSYRQSALARMLQEEEEEGEGKLLTDPLPLYVYRTRWVVDGVVNG